MLALLERHFEANAAVSEAGLAAITNLAVVEANRANLAGACDRKSHIVTFLKRYVTILIQDSQKFLILSYLFLIFLHYLPYETAAVIVRVLRTHAAYRAHDVALQGAWAIHNVAGVDWPTQQRFVAAEAWTVLEAIRDDPASSVQAKDIACNALEKLSVRVRSSFKNVLTGLSAIVDN